MMLLQTIKDEALKARKDAMTEPQTENHVVKASLLTTLLSDIQMRAKNDGNRQPIDKDAQKVLEKFVKLNAESISLRSTPKLVEERAILQYLVSTIPVNLTCVVIDYKSVVAQVIQDNKEKFEQAKTNPKLLGFFTGQVMKLTHGKANPTIALKYLNKALEA